MELSFGEQIKILLKRRNMTIKDLAVLVEQQTGKPTSRQNLTQKLSRNNFQERDMRDIAAALGCTINISVIPISAEEPFDHAQPAARESVREEPSLKEEPSVKEESFSKEEPRTEEASSVKEEDEDDMLYIKKTEPDKKAMSRDLSSLLNPLMQTEHRKRPERSHAAFTFPAKNQTESSFSRDEETKKTEPAEELQPRQESGPDRHAPADKDFRSESEKRPPDLPPESINPLTGEEYLNNTVRAAAGHAGYVEVYDAAEHCWSETNEAEFQRFQEQKRQMLGAEYEPPVYI